MTRIFLALTVGLIALLILAAPGVEAAEGEHPRHIDYVPTAPAPRAQLPEQAMGKSAGCITCHTRTDSFSMHKTPGVILGCVDCHGGDASVKALSIEDRDAITRAHVQPRYPKTWHHPSSANP